MPVPRLIRGAPTGLRKRLLFLVLASVLPFVLLIGLVARQNLLDEKPVFRDRALARSQSVADQIDTRIASTRGVMQALAPSVSGSAAHRASNDRALKNFASSFGADVASWRAFDRSGNLVGTSSADERAPPMAYVRALWSAATEDGAFLTEPMNTPGSGYVVHMILPLRDARGDSALLVAQIRLASLQPLLSTRGLPDGSSTVLMSQRGTVLGREPDATRWVGRDLSGFGPYQLSRGKTSGVHEMETPDGVNRMLAFARTRNAPWLVWTGIPMTAVLADARLDFERAIGYGALALALALLLALWQASRITEPIMRLSEDAAKLGTGNLAHRSGVLGRDELGTLAATINEMATTLEQQGAILKESEERYRGLFDINPLPMWVMDPETLDFLAVNRAAVDTYGYSEEELLRMKVTEIRPPHTVPDLLNRLADPRVHRYRTQHLRKDGTVLDVEIDSGAMMFGGRLARLVVAHDVSERVRAEAALRDAELQLRQSQRLEAIGQLTGGIAHDFNNVLTAIGSYSDFLYESLEPGDARRLDIQEIRKAADRAAGLTKQLLAFSRSQILQPRVIDINEALSDLELLLKRVVTADIELHFALDPDVGHVRADPGQLAQVVINLAVNARDAMPDGGVLTITARNEDVAEPDPDAADAPLVKPGQYVRIEVTDTGIGMDQDTLHRIFEPFFTTKGAGKGTGLGLSTVHGIVHQSGGYISAESSPGRGATFAIRLPRVDQAVEPEGPKAPRADAGHRSETILVVEDEEAVRSAAKRILVKKGYTVIEAVDGNAALQIIRAHPKIDLLLTDLVMPGMGGRELVRELRRQSRAIPTLYMSGYTKDAVMRAELDPDIAVLEKPFSQEELAAKVREVLDKNGKT